MRLLKPFVAFAMGRSAAGVKGIKASADAYKGIPGGMKRMVDHHTGRLSLPGKNGEESIGL